MKKNKIYGYMVGYRELGSRFVRYYTTFTYKNALSSLLYYRKSPPRERETNRPLIDPVWEIQPITKKAILRSILDEIPFLWKYRLFLCSLWLSSHRLNPKVNAKKFLDSIYFSFPNKNFYRISLTFGLRSIRTWYAHFYPMHFRPCRKRQNKKTKEKGICIKKTFTEHLTSGEMEIYYIYFLPFQIRNINSIKTRLIT